MNKSDILNKLNQLDLNKNEIIIVGDSSLVMQDVIDEVEKIDISCSDNYYNELNNLDDIYNLSCDYYFIDDCIVVDDYRVLNIEKIYDIKKKINLKKDKKIIEKLDQYLCSKDNYRYERKLKETGINVIAGVDEVGRGPLVGPVVAACVVLPEKYDLDGLTDSKKLSEKKREYYFKRIKEQALGIGVGIISEKIIDEINIYEATKLAMKKAIDECNSKINIEHILIDAMPLDLDIPTTSIIKGDLKSITISAASVIAKVTRDHMLDQLDMIYPMYDFKNNKGYPTKKHLEAIEKYGVIDEHRRSYGPVMKYLEKNK